MVINPEASGMNFPPINTPAGFINGGGIINASSSTNSISNLPSIVTSSPLQSLCCLVENGIKCSRPSGNASYSKRIEKQASGQSFDRHTPHTYICEHHKQIIQSIRTSGKRKRKDDDNGHDDDLSNDVHDRNDSYASGPARAFNTTAYDIDLQTLQVNTLRRYKKTFRVQTKPGLNKTQLAEELTRHFRMNIRVDEKEIIHNFMSNIKSNNNKAEFNPNSKND
ncbi:Histone deacetylase complex subunit sap30l [Tyrophagus putrescentiae]|nr:Histone deacetylase complex subunit sap30l [Tyrophagus putrescentiae]